MWNNASDFESPQLRDRTLECSTSGRSISEGIFASRTQGTPLSKGNKDLLAGRAVGLLREREFPCKQWLPLDKAFACAWLSEQQVVVGTKCNKLLLLNADYHQRPDIPLIQPIALPPAPVRPVRSAPRPEAGLAGVQHALWTIRAHTGGQSSGSTSGSASAMEEDTVAGMLARAIAAIDDQYTGPPRPGDFVVSNGGVQIANCGIHCISVSPCRTLLASGGSDPCDCQIFRIEGDENGPLALQPAQTLVGHKDWLFGSAWVTDRHVVTGSRDSTLKLWCINPKGSKPHKRPLQTATEESGKVRDVKYLEDHQRVVSLSVDGTVHLWDAHLNSISASKTPHGKEVVCMAASGALVAVGSQNHATIFDTRCRVCVWSIPNEDHNHSVRSLAFSRGLLSIGGGRGRINFFDLRAARFVQPEEGSLDSLGRRRLSHLQTGPGHLYRNQVYLEHFSGTEVRNACYAHAWNASHSRLLAVGGPLAFGLTGCYMGLWE